MRPFTLTKTISGIQFKYATYGDLKATAKAAAVLYRMSGYLARVTKEKSMLGKIIYTVWIRKIARR